MANFLTQLSEAHSVGNRAQKVDQWRVYSYKKAASRVRTWPVALDPDDPGTLQALEDAKGPPGPKTIQKIREWLVTGRSERMDR